MTTLALKLIAIGCMLIDHTAIVLLYAGCLRGGVLYAALRAVGRMAFPLFCFLLANGFEKTRDRKTYLTRLLLLAAVSQLPYSLALTEGNYSAAPGPVHLALLPGWWLIVPTALCFLLTVCGARAERSFFVFLLAALVGQLRLTVGSITVLGEKGNVFYTLATGLALMMAQEKADDEHVPVGKKLLGLAGMVLWLLSVQIRASYSLWGVWLMLGLTLIRYWRSMKAYRELLQGAVLLLWSILLYAGQSLWFSLAAGLTAMAPLLYNGRPGKGTHRLFYAVYPVHLMLLWIGFGVIM